MSRIGIVNCLKMPEPDPDETLLLDALAAAGLEAALVPWDHPSSRPQDFDLCVLRSCWNYFQRPGDFLRWVDTTAACTRLLNPAPVVAVNAHKQYLATLDAAGVPIVPTAWIRRGQSTDLATLLAGRGWDDVVIKPCVSAGSFATRRFAGPDWTDGQRFLDDLVADRDTMIQPYLKEVERSGEKSIVWIDGRLTHTVRKNPRFAGGAEGVSDALPVSSREAKFAARVMTHAGEGLLYARIDVINDDAGGLLLSELELIEPSLFLQQNPDALSLLVAAIARASQS